MGGHGREWARVRQNDGCREAAYEPLRRLAAKDARAPFENPFAGFDIAGASVPESAASAALAAPTPRKEGNPRGGSVEEGYHGRHLRPDL